MQKHDASLVFDLDGTLIDSVYQHVMAWQTALRKADIDLSFWRIHRRIGMSGGLFVRALARELGHDVDEATIRTLQREHEAAYLEIVDTVRPLPGSRELLATLSREHVPWAIATSGARAPAQRAMRVLEVPESVPVITRTEVAHAKPNPDLFVAASAALNVHPQATFVVGDSLWDVLGARRAGAIAIGVLSGGYGRAELIEGGAYRVYNDPADLLSHLDELGLRIA
ncbi:MAG TPA: HAD family hydrolase [Candidatus Baltobacteraceae bacterium]|jgi:HAD superfamily hydrolase (TIGR01509 family)|nr:HAD family hydrolase [Candidatus Baltobacteraceae bacterium]